MHIFHRPLRDFSLREATEMVLQINPVFKWMNPATGSESHRAKVDQWFDANTVK